MNGDSLERLLREALTAKVADAPAHRTVAAFWGEHVARTLEVESAFDRAVLGGVHASTVGQAFVAGYRAAMQRLVPAIDRRCAASLCVTEAGGGHPRAIETTLVRDASGLRLQGSKRWATLGDAADALLVVARAGTSDDGRPSLVVVRLAANREGVIVEPMPETPFVPDVLHGALRFDAVSVDDSDVLEGDGYDRYVKPFRTVEDLHVHGALLGYLLSTARVSAWPGEVIASLLGPLAAARALAEAPPDDAAAHLATHSTLAWTRHVVDALEPQWTSAPAKRRDGFARDRPLLEVASRARAQRTVAALRSLGLRE